MRLSTIELHKEKMNFSAGHFTILSPTKRERLHGHNYQVYCALTTLVGDLGLTFDYREYKNKLINLCQELNEVFLIPGDSKYCILKEENDYVYVHFNAEKIPFLKRDIKVISVVNISVEELSAWFLRKLTQNKAELNKHAIQKVLIKISSSPGQWGSASWELES